MGDAAFTDRNVLERYNSQSVVLQKALSNGFKTLISERVVVQVYFAQFVLVGQDGSYFFGANLCDLIALEVETEEGIILFKSFSQSNDAFVFDIIIFEADLLK